LDVFVIDTSFILFPSFFMKKVSLAVLGAAALTLAACQADVNGTIDDGMSTSSEAMIEETMSSDMSSSSSDAAMDASVDANVEVSE
jgi:hypothetical protein